MVDIYTNETCPYCKQIKEELTKNNIEFNERLTKDWPAKWKDIVSLTGIPTVPTICYKENYFVPGRDFNTPPHLVAIIKDFDTCSFSNEIQLLEKIKTLNYNISMAFKSLDQLLRQIETKINTDEHKSTN